MSSADLSGHWIDRVHDRPPPNGIVLDQFGGLERGALRSGNVHSADGLTDVLEPVVVRHRGQFKRRYFRADADFANPEVYEFPEAEGFKHAILSRRTRLAGTFPLRPAEAGRNFRSELRQ